MIIKKHIDSYNIFLEKYNWEELRKGDNTIKVVKPKDENYVVKLSNDYSAANVAQLISNHKNNSFVANIYRVDKVKSKKIYFIVEEYVQPLSKFDIEKATKSLIKIIMNSTSRKIPTVFEEAKKGVLDILFYLWENDIAVEHELLYSYGPIFSYLSKSLKIKDFDLNSQNMAKRKDKYILFDISGDIKKQEINEIIVPDQYKNDLDSTFEWYINKIINNK